MGLHARPWGLSLEFGDRADHELVKQGNGEGHVAVRRAADHPFLDQFGSHGSQAGHLDALSVGDVPGSMRLRSQVGHGAEKVPFAGRQAIVAHPKEALVKPRNDRGGCRLHNRERDGAGGSQITRLVAPFLAEFRFYSVMLQTE